MLAQAFHGGPLVDVFSAQGTKASALCKTFGNVKKDFDKTVKGYVLELEGGRDVRLQFPPNEKESRECSSKFDWREPHKSSKTETGICHCMVHVGTLILVPIRNLSVASAWTEYQRWEPCRCAPTSVCPVFNLVHQSLACGSWKDNHACITTQHFIRASCF
jgi:hypothetical protein